MGEVRVCYRCRREHGRGPRETRPYGPGGAPLCAGCMFGEDGNAPSPDVQAEAKRQFNAAMDAAERDTSIDGPVIFGDAAGPRRHPRKAGN